MTKNFMLLTKKKLWEFLMPSYNQMYIAVLRQEKDHLMSLHDPHQEGTGHFVTAANVLAERIREILKSEAIIENND